MAAATGDQPPLWPFVARNSRDLLVFSWVFARSIARYLVWFYAFVWRGLRFGSKISLRLKAILLRLLMRRGSFFAPAPRLGLATVTSTTVFSLLFVPISGTIHQSDSGVEQILSQPSTLPDSQDAKASDVVAATSILAQGKKDLRNEVIDYKVQPGDTLSTISEKFLVNTEALAYVNGFSSSALLHPGDILKIPPSSGIDGDGTTLIHTVKAGDTVSSIAAEYNVSPQAVVDFNYLEEPFLLHEGDELFIPEATIPKPTPVYYAADQSEPPNSGGLSLESLPAASDAAGLTMPTLGSVTQYFSWYHPAIDIANACGTPITAADNGTITFARWWPGGGGNSIFIDHGNGYITKYAHMSGFAKTAGTVHKGEIIGYMGATGRAFGCHLHFIVEKGGRAINPLDVL